jgi:hypothetical protein
MAGDEEDGWPVAESGLGEGARDGWFDVVAIAEAGWRAKGSGLNRTTEMEKKQEKSVIQCCVTEGRESKVEGDRTEAL